ncbi:MAG: bifunctional 4-hydroxy-2-oxoglutarate aldolase/2-dehydro-3-deoxy-phosphogluconate aldolase [Culicoidibacterales bacterium]
MLQKLQKSGLIAVVRASNHDEALTSMAALIEGGISALELTYTIPDVCELITKAKEMYPQADIGVGSVLNRQMAIDAIAAGATYVVSPGFADEIDQACKENEVLYIPGCMTIAEMMHALACGNEMIKLFPGEVFGPKYVKAIKAPIPQLAIMPTGGVTLENMSEWFEMGVSCVGIGSALFVDKNPEAITKVAQKYRQRYEEIQYGA